MPYGARPTNICYLQINRVPKPPIFQILVPRGRSPSEERCRIVPPSVVHHFPVSSLTPFPRVGKYSLGVDGIDWVRVLLVQLDKYSHFGSTRLVEKFQGGEL